MDTPPRGALLLVRFIAAGLVGLSVLEAGLYVAECVAHHQPIQVLHGLVLFLPLVLGIFILVQARAIAEWLANKFD